MVKFFFPKPKMVVLFQLAMDSLLESTHFFASPFKKTNSSLPLKNAGFLQTIRRNLFEMVPFLGDHSVNIFLGGNVTDLKSSGGLNMIFDFSR